MGTDEIVITSRPRPSWHREQDEIFVGREIDMARFKGQVFGLQEMRERCGAVDFDKKIVTQQL